MAGSPLSLVIPAKAGIQSGRTDFHAAPGFRSGQALAPGFRRGDALSSHGVAVIWHRH